MSMKRALVGPSLALMVVTLTACTAVAPVTEKPLPQTSASSVQTGASTAPASETAEEDELIIDVAGVSYVHEGATQSVPFSDPAALKDLLSAIGGDTPTETPVEPFPGYEHSLTRYDYGGILLVTDEDGPAGIQVVTTAFHGIPVRTPEGIGVGSTRNEALGTGAKESYDDDGDGIPDWMNLGAVEVPGTQSLATPGATGVQYVLIGMDGDVVSKLQAPGNHFSDL